MNGIVWDLREAFRGLQKSPGLVAVCVLSLGLGIGVNLTLFSWLSAMFFDQPTIAQPMDVGGVEPGNSNQFSYLNYRDLKDAAIFESVVGYRRSALSLRTGDTTRAVSGMAVSGNFFEGLGVQVQFGRVFTDKEAAPERNARLVVASHRFWRRSLESDLNAIGRTIALNGERYTLLGVLPASYRSVTPIDSPDLYVPLNVLGATNLAQRGNDNGLIVIARLRPGMRLAQARAQLTAFGQRLEQAFPVDNRGMKDPAAVFPSSDLRMRGAPGDTSTLAGFLMGLFGLVLLVACGNVAGLLMARGATRQQDIAVRFALGASRRRVMQNVLAEASILAMLGGGTALLVLTFLAPALSDLGLPGLSGARLELHPDRALVVYAVLMTLVTVLLCGITPAFRSTRGPIAADIQKGTSRTATGHLRLRHCFVVAQVAISLFLLVVASLFLRSLVRLSSVNPGFDVAHGVVVRIPASSIPPGHQLIMSERVAGRLRQVAGVRSVGTAMLIPLGGDLRGERFSVDGRSTPGPRTFVNSISPGYIATMGMQLLRGRDFQLSDRPGAPQVAIVSDAFTKAYFPGDDALGKTLHLSTGETATIIGIVNDHAYRNRGGVREPVLYRAYAQIPNMSSQPRPLIIQVRTERPSDESLPAIRLAMTELDPNGPAYVDTLAQATSQEIVMRRVMGSLLSAVGGLGLLLATIGLYGVMAHVVASQYAEIAIRMALGASGETVLWSVLKRGLRLVILGIGLGSTIALAATQPLRAMLAGLSPSDPVAFAGTTAVLTLVGLLASYVPARRATRVDPMEALRQQ